MTPGNMPFLSNPAARPIRLGKFIPQIVTLSSLVGTKYLITDLLICDFSILERIPHAISWDNSGSSPKKTGLITFL